MKEKGEACALRIFYARENSLHRKKKIYHAKGLLFYSLRELPLVVAVDASNEGSHGLISTTRLHLIIARLLLLAFAALECVRLGFLRLGALRIMEILLTKSLVLLLQYFGCQLFRAHND